MSRRRDQRNQRHIVPAEHIQQLPAVLIDHVHGKHGVHPGRFGCGGKCFESAAEQDIVIRKQDKRRFGIFDAETRNAVKNILQLRSMLQRFLTGETDHGTVRHRVGKRHSEFDNIHAVVDQRFHGAFTVFHIRKSHRQIGGENLFAGRFRGGEQCLNTVHVQIPFFDAL